MGIDFTGSNGDIRLPTSLHYQNPYQPNDYVRVLQSIGGVISYYDTDKMFPSFGFGGKFADGTVSHDFALVMLYHAGLCVPPPGQANRFFVCRTSNRPTRTARASAASSRRTSAPSPACSFGVRASGQPPFFVMLIRGAVLRGRTGPTNFAPIINQVARFAAQADAAMTANPAGKQTYFVLLIITDGAISDTGATQSAIVAASALPLSLIIVGVGNADFSEMQVLDGDNVRVLTRACFFLEMPLLTAPGFWLFCAGVQGSLKCPGTGRLATRDIVQFVPFNAMNGDVERLSNELLAEVPGQVVSYMKSRGVVPHPPPPVAAGFMAAAAAAP